MNELWKFTVITLMLFVPTLVCANPYLTVNQDLVDKAFSVFSEITVFNFDPSVRTVGEAVTVVAEHAGYRLADDLLATDPYIKHLLDAPLPIRHRVLGPVSVQQALEALGGQGWRLALDPVHRLVSYEVDESFQPCGYEPARQGCP